MGVILFFCPTPSEMIERLIDNFKSHVLPSKIQDSLNILSPSPLYISKSRGLSMSFDSNKEKRGRYVEDFD